MKEKEMSAIKTWREMRKEMVEKMLNHPESRQRAQEELRNSVNDYDRLVNYVLLGTIFQVMSDWEDMAIAKLDSAIKPEAFELTDLSNLN